MKTTLKSHQPSGFSFVEMIAVVAIIGGLVLGAIPTISSVVGQSEDTTIRANARHLADTAYVAISAGSESLLAAASKEEIVNHLRTGVYGDGDFAGNRFQVALSQEEAEAAMARLHFADGVLSVGE